MARFFNNIRCVILALLCSMAIVSCDNSDDIGDLYGMWKIEKIEYNGVTSTPDNLFLCFQSQYVNAQYVVGHGSTDAFGRYSNAAGEMTMTFYYSEVADPNAPDTDPNNPKQFLAPFCFFDNGTPLTDEEKNLQIAPVHLRFKVEASSSSMMILTTPEGKWYLKKY